MQAGTLPTQQLWPRPFENRSEDHLQCWAKVRADLLAKKLRSLLEVGLYLGLSSHGARLLLLAKLAKFIRYLQLETTASRAMLAVADTFQACQSTPDCCSLGQDGEVRSLYLYCLPWAGNVWVCGRSLW